MHIVFDEVVAGGLVVTGVWAALSLALALLLGRILHARDTHELPTRLRRPQRAHTF